MSPPPPVPPCPATDRPRAATGRDRSRHPADDGAFAVWAAVLGLVFLLLASLVYDGGMKLRGGREASSIADEAARAGAGLVDQDQAYSTGTYTVDRAAAIKAAQQFLAGEGRTGTVTVQGDTLTVTVTVTKKAVLLAAFGGGDLTTTAAASANLLTGVREPG